MSFDQNPFSSSVSPDPTPFPKNPHVQTNALAIVSLVFGILSLTMGCCCLLYIPLGLVAVICGILGIANAEQSGGKGMAIAGLVCGGLALVGYTLIQLFAMFGRAAFDPSMFR